MERTDNRLKFQLVGTILFIMSRWQIVLRLSVGVGEGAAVGGVGGWVGSAFDTNKDRCKEQGTTLHCTTPLQRPVSCGNRRSVRSILFVVEL